MAYILHNKCTSLSEPGLYIAEILVLFLLGVTSLVSCPRSCLVLRFGTACVHTFVYKKHIFATNLSCLPHLVVFNYFFTSYQIVYWLPRVMLIAKFLPVDEILQFSINLPVPSYRVHLYTKETSNTCSRIM